MTASFTYTVTVSMTEGSHTFRGTLRDIRPAGHRPSAAMSMVTVEEMTAPTGPTDGRKC